mgnify:CR=1 FL=1
MSTINNCLINLPDDILINIYKLVHVENLEAVHNEMGYIEMCKNQHNYYTKQLNYEFLNMWWPASVERWRVETSI